MDPKTIKIKPTHDSQGDYVVINEDDFNPELHELVEEDETKAAPAKKPGDMTAAEMKVLLDQKGIEYKGNASKAELQALLDA